MIEGRKIAAAFADDGGAVLADALVGSFFLPNPAEVKAFEITRADPSALTVTVTRSNGIAFHAQVAAGDVDPTATFAEAWKTHESESDARLLRAAGIEETFSTDDATILLRCLKGSMPSATEGRAAVDVTRKRRSPATLKALCAHWIRIGGPWPFDVMRDAAVFLRKNGYFPEALDLLAAIEPGVGEGNRAILLSQRAASLMNMVEHRGDGAALERANDCLGLLERVRPGENDLLWEKFGRLTRIA